MIYTLLLSISSLVKIKNKSDTDVFKCWGNKMYYPIKKVSQKR